MHIKLHKGINDILDWTSNRKCALTQWWATPLQWLNWVDIPQLVKRIHWTYASHFVVKIQFIYLVNNVGFPVVNAILSIRSIHFYKNSIYVYMFCGIINSGGPLFVDFVFFKGSWSCNFVKWFTCTETYDSFGMVFCMCGVTTKFMKNSRISNYSTVYVWFFFCFGQK